MVELLLGGGSEPAVTDADLLLGNNVGTVGSSPGTCTRMRNRALASSESRLTTTSKRSVAVHHVDRLRADRAGRSENGDAFHPGKNAPARRGEATSLGAN